MNKYKLHLISAGVFVLLILAGALLAKEKEEQVFTIEIAAVPEAVFYQIHFVEGEADFNKDTGGVTIRFDKLTFRQKIQKNLRFFRIRALGEHNIPGPWSAFHNTRDFTHTIKLRTAFRGVKHKDGLTRKYFFGKRLVFQARDSGPGKVKTFYSINNGPFLEAGNAMDLPEDGEYTVRYFSVDAVGNKEQLRSVSFRIDRTPPVSQAVFVKQIISRENRNFTGKNNSIHIKSLDALSGTRKVYFRMYKQFADAPYLLYQGPLKVNDFYKQGPGTYVLEYYAEDNVGNKERPRRTYILVNDDTVAWVGRGGDWRWVGVFWGRGFNNTSILDRRTNDVLELKRLIRPTVRTISYYKRKPCISTT